MKNKFDFLFMILIIAFVLL